MEMSKFLDHPFFAGIFTEDPNIVKLKKQKERLTAINERLDKLEKELLELNGEGDWMLTFVPKNKENKKDAC